jgi:hypothetical protein
MIIVALQEKPNWNNYSNIVDYNLIDCVGTNSAFINHHILNDFEAVKSLLQLGVKYIRFQDIPKDLLSLDTYSILSNAAQSVGITN